MENLLNKLISINGLSLGACIETSSPIGFRPSPKASDLIKQKVREHRLKEPKKKVSTSQIINELLESIADGTVTEKGISPIPRVLVVLCPDKDRFVTKQYCLNARLNACVDCSTGDKVLVGMKHAPLDIEKPKKEE